MDTLGIRATVPDTCRLLYFMITHLVELVEQDLETPTVVLGPE